MQRHPILFAVLALLVLAGLADTFIATGAAGFSAEARQRWALVSDLGLSRPMYAVCLAIMAVALLLRSRVSSPRVGLALRLVVERCIYFGLSVLAAATVAEIVKHSLGRGRPKLLIDFGAYHFVPLSMPNTYASFPSGHTTNAFCAAMALGLMAPRLRPLVFTLAVLIGLSRIGVGAHYPSDVVAGAALGSLMAVLLAYGFKARGFVFDATRKPLVIRPLPARP